MTTDDRATERLAGRARVTTGVVITVLLIGGGSFWVLQDFYRQQMIDSLAASTTGHGELIEQSLRYAMHTRSLDLLAEMVRSLASQKPVENVMILDKKGVVRFASDPDQRGAVLAQSDPTCNICHQGGPSVRGRTVIFEVNDGTRVFRNVNPIMNSRSCMSCHSPDDRVNGVLIVDYSMADIDASLEASARKMWLSAVTLAAAITVVIMFLMRKLVLQRLRGVVQAIDSIKAGRLDLSVEERGSDEITVVSRHLNSMTRSLDRSLRNLKEREAFLDAVINSADDGIVVVDSDLRVVAANHAFEALRGTQRQVLVDGRCNCAVPCATHDAAECPALFTFRTGRVARRIRSVPDAGGNTRHYEISASPLKDGSGGPRALEIWRDITQRRELEAHLAHSERLASLGLLASGISHEINNPLASITTCLDGLRRRLTASDGARVPPELPEYLQLIRGEVERCRDLTERLKTLGRESPEESRFVDINAVVLDSLTLVRYEARTRSVHIEERLAPNLAPVLADPSQVRQVILNLVLNAIQAIDGTGWVRVATVPTSGGDIRVEVADTGCGIESARLEQVFEPFYSARADGRGSGLGLFISKIIVDRLKGSIRIASESGAGTVVTVLLPGAPARSGTPVEVAK